MSYKPERALTLDTDVQLSTWLQGRNELQAREGIDTQEDDMQQARSCKSKNELQAREGIDTRFQLSPI